MPYKVEAKCPKCGKKIKGKNFLERLFGWRNVGKEKIIPQSWCRECRSKYRKK